LKQLNLFDVGASTFMMVVIFHYLRCIQFNNNYHQVNVFKLALCLVPQINDIKDYFMYL